MVPTGLSLIILKECGFVVSDKDEAAQIRCMRKGKGIFIIIPKLEMCFVIHPMTDKCMLIGHNIVSLMPVNIHSVLYFTVAPVYLCEPPLCCQHQNSRLVNSQPREQALDLLTFNNLTDILCFDKTIPHSLWQLSLDILQDFFVLKNHPSGVPIGMKGKCHLLDEVKHPSPDAARMGWPIPLCLCHNHWSLPPGVPKFKIQKEIQDSNYGRDVSPKDDIKWLILAWW